MDLRKLTSFCCKGSTVCVNILSHIVLLGQVEQLTDFGCSLWTPHPWLLNISETGQVTLTLFHNYQVQNREVWADNAPTNRFPSTLSIAPSISTETRSSCSNAKNINKTANKHGYENLA